MANQENRANDQQNQSIEGHINVKDFLIGALVGGIVGAATALFLAPKSGKEIRNDLSVQAHTLKDKTDHLRENAKIRGTEFVEAAKEKSNTLGQSVTKQSNEILSKVKSLKPFQAATEPLDEVQEEIMEEETSFTSNNSEDIQRKLEETKKAFDETETLLNQ